jgi:putative ABC transport system permease protein
VVRAAVIESVAVAIIGLALGCLVAGAGLTGIGGATNKAVGTVVVAVPWTLLAVVTFGSVFVVALTSGITAIVATRQQPVSLIAARE